MMSQNLSAILFTFGLSHLVACGEKDTGPVDVDNDGIVASEDCDDGNSAINDSATDTVGDGIDQNCDGIDGTDMDGDGLASVASGGMDCDDEDADETVSMGMVFYIDADGDGFGDASQEVTACESPVGYVDNADDCDDADAGISPAAEEICDGVDNDCDALTDDDDDSIMGQGTYFADGDGDGFGDPMAPKVTCDVPEGFIDNDGDCDDTDAMVNPDAEDVIADGLDSDCDTIELCYEDLDGDGFGIENTVELTDDGNGGLDCAVAVGTSDNWSDCDDTNADINPDALEICDGGVDNDCNGMADDADSNTDLTTGMSYFVDADGDGFGSASIMACEQTTGLVTQDGDCNDSLPSSNPMATDIAGDSIDQNCDGVDGLDMDGDGYASVASGGMDCDDTDGYINPAALEECDMIDNDCDGFIDDADDSVDIDQTTEFYSDNDGDGFGDPNATMNLCFLAPGYVSDDTDCDDSDPSTYPGAAYLQSSSDCLTDSDGDGWGTGSTSGDTCYTVEMMDSFGDGWNGNQVDIYEDGQFVDSATFTSGYGDVHEYCGSEGSLIEFFFIEGQWTSEVSYNILNPNGDTLVEVATGAAVENGFVVVDDVVFTSTVSVVGDCDDGNVDINPDATETCDEIDNNCDGQVDEGVATMYYVDADSDGFGDASNIVEACELPMGASEVDGDCDDLDGMVNPDATEVCDGMDNNCDTQVDEGLLSMLFVDEDGDGYGNPSNFEMRCDDGDSMWTGDASDCDDSRADTYPGAAELESGACMTDADDDGYGDMNAPSYITAGSDCDDNSATAYVGSAELDSTSECMEDMDGDGYGDANAQSPVMAGSDCADTQIYINPMATDIAGDGVDQNCDAVDGTDSDGDGDPSVVSGGTDCDDTDATRENLDVDGDGQTTCDTDCDDFDPNTIGDDDSDGYFSCEDDCDDADSSVNPGETEVWYDGIDQDCDGANDYDQDMDGEDSADHGGTDCDDTNPDVNTDDDDNDGFSSCDGDCWDSADDADSDGVIDSSTTYPGAAFNDSLELCLTDNDGDGYAQMPDGTQCYTFETFDSYGDGWNGNSLDIYESGTLVLSVENQNEDGSTSATPGGEYMTVEYCPDPMASTIEIRYTDGQYNSEVAFDLYSPYGQLIASGEGSGTTDLIVDGVTYTDGDTILTFYQYGMDCDDADANVYGGSDNDGDGYLACYADCNDYDATVNNGATETWYDGVDQDCDGLSDYDQDMDGDDDINYGGTDCDDQDSMVEGLDIDGDGVSTCDGDCDDSDETIYAGATETWYDGIDQDCSGGSDYDQDGDGEESYESGMGMDCDDTDANTIGDDDGDGYFVCETVPDCDDGDGTVYPGATEIFDDGIDQDCDGADLVAMASCDAFASAGYTQDGVYTLLASDGSTYDAYCDMNIDGGGWTKIVSTTGNNQVFGQTTSSIVNSYANVSDAEGVYEAFQKLDGFSQVMISKTSGTYAGEYAAYNLVETITGQSVLDVLLYCSAQTEVVNNDFYWDGVRVLGYTSFHSGTIYSGNLQMTGNGSIVTPTYFFMCGVNESSDNDQSVMAFADNRGDSNYWGDEWRGTGQLGTMWSFWNGDYHTAGTYHIGNGYVNAYAGYKGSGVNLGSYEVYIR